MQKTFSCEYKVEDLRDNLLVIESAKMHGDEPIFTLIGDLPKTLQNGNVFTLSVKHLGNAPVGNFLQSFEIRGRGDSGKEIVLLSDIVGLVIE